MCRVSQFTALCQQQDCTDGQNLKAAPIAVKGTLYGTTAFGGIGGGLGGGGGGVMFSIDPTTGTEKPLYAFCRLDNCQDGGNPRGSVIDVNGTMFGVTSGGGAQGAGHRGRRLWLRDGVFHRPEYRCREGDSFVLQSAELH
ncbi:MAG TPA: hypothetical protein VHY79_06840 [Rhizomicrobium sp.]|jgi:hypothetical protein|nr:hypothetical protein [Rhizomicrobium sp.]